jgi:hypothetical protein
MTGWTGCRRAAEGGGDLCPTQGLLPKLDFIKRNRPLPDRNARLTANVGPVHKYATSCQPIHEHHLLYDGTYI